MPSVSGLVSGLDTASIISQLMALQTRPVQMLQDRVKTSTTQQTEIKALTAKLLSLKMDAGTLATAATFEAKKISSSSESALTATVDSSAAEGAYTFTVGKLSKTSQILSNGFAAKDTAIGKGRITLEIGNGFVDRKTRVDFLNGGAGIDRGSFKLTDGTGNTATIDVSATATVQDILDAVNTGATKITASLSADGIVLTDASASPSITVSEVGGHTTAADLGLLGQTLANGRITGSRINLIAGETRLDSLNDGNGVRTTYEAGLGAALADLNFTARSGATFTVDLNGGSSTSPVTVQDVLTAINNASGNAGKVTASISSDAQSLTLTDNTAGAGVLTVAALNSSNALTDLGLSGVVQEASTTGVEDAVNGDRIVGRRLVSALNSVLTQTLNGGRRLSPAASGGVTDGSIAFTDRAGTSTTVDLTARKATTLAVAALSTDTSVTLTSAAGFAAGNLVRLTNGASTILRRVTSVNYATGAVSFDQQLGTALALGSGAYASNESVSDVVNAVTGRTGGTLTLSFNGEGNGLKVLDHSGGTGLLRVQESGATTAEDLKIKTIDVTGQAPDALGTTTTFVDADLSAFGDALVGMQLEVTAGANAGYSGKILDFDATTNTVTLDTASTAAFSAADTYRITGINASSANGRDLDPAYLTERTTLASLNGGKGVFAGSLQITDRAGRVITADLSTVTRISQVLLNINGAAAAAGSPLTATINATGDGILLTHSTGSGSIKVVEVSGGTTAKDLNLLGTGSGTTLNGAFEYSVDISATDTLETVRDAINALKIPVAATIIQDGSPTTPYRLNLTSQRSGLAGKLVVDPQRRNLSFQTVSQGEDAALLFGTSSGGGSPVLFTSSNNTISNVVPGITLSLKAAGPGPVSVTVTRDTDYIAKQVNDFVVNYNGIVSQINSDLQYDPATSRGGILRGVSSATNLQRDLARMMLQRVPGLASSLNGLDKVGVKLGTGGQISFNQTVFLDKIASDFKGVKQLFMQGADIAVGTPLSTLRQGKGIRTAGDAVQDFQIRLRDGTLLKVSLTANVEGEASSIQAVLTAINNATGNGGKLAASVSSDGTGLTLLDSSSGSNALTVTALNSSHAAEDLGIQKVASFVTGSSTTTLKGSAINQGGIANRLKDRLDFISSDENGILPSASGILGKQITDMNASIKKLQARLTQQQRRLEEQFNNLESTLAGLSSTSSFLASQLAGLQGSAATGNKKK